MLALTFDDLRNYIQSGVVAWPILVAAWGGILFISQRAAAERVRKERDTEAALYNRQRDLRQGELGELEKRKEEYADKIYRQSARRIKILSDASKELRRLLTIIMARSDLQDRWIASLETVVTDHKPELLSHRPDFGPKVTAMDVSAVFVEQGDLGDDGK